MQVRLVIVVNPSQTRNNENDHLSVLFLHVSVLFLHGISVVLIQTIE